MRKYFVLTILIGLGCFILLTALNSRAVDVKADHRPMVKAFFQKIQEGKHEEAVRDFFSTNPWMARVPDVVNRASSQFVALQGNLGEYHGHQLLVEKVVAGRFLHASYFAFYDRQPLRFIFEFYKPQDTWLPYTFVFDDAFSQELKAATSLETILKVQ